MRLGLIDWCLARCHIECVFERFGVRCHRPLLFLGGGGDRWVDNVQLAQPSWRNDIMENGMKEMNEGKITLS